MTRHTNIQVILLAGGKSRRMQTGGSKVLQKIHNETIISRDLRLLNRLNLINNTVVVLSFDNEAIKGEIASAGYKPAFTDQGEPLGTAHAVKTGLTQDSNLETTLVMYGDDSSLYQPQTVKDFIDFHIKNNSVMTLLTVKQEEVKYLGFLKKDSLGHIIGIDGPSSEVNLLEKETVCGAFCFNTFWLKSHIDLVKMNDFNGEYPLPGLIPLAASEQKYPISFNLPNIYEWTGVNTPEELGRARNYQDILIHGKS